MQQWPALLVAAVITLLSGCVSEEGIKKTAWADRFQANQLAKLNNIVQIEIALIERRVGDKYINTDVWSYINEQVIDIDRKPAVEANGFRTGTVVGSVPAGLHALLTSERCCINPRCYMMPVGKERRIMLNSPQSKFCYDIKDNGLTISEELASARCSLMVVPSFTDDGRTCLKFTPQVEHGETIPSMHAAKDLSGWVLEYGPKKKQYRQLSWEVVLSPNEYYIVGGLVELPNSLGMQCFLDKSYGTPVQRMLVLRIASTAGGVDSEIARTPQLDSPPANAPPLALQATLPTIRGASR